MMNKKNPWIRVLKYAASLTNKQLKRHPGICSLLMVAESRGHITTSEYMACNRLIRLHLKATHYKYTFPSGMQCTGAYLDPPNEWSARLLFLMILAGLDDDEIN